MSYRFSVRMIYGSFSGFFFMALASSIVRYFDGPHWAAMGTALVVGSVVVCSNWVVACIKDNP